MKVTVNGEPREVAEDATVADVLAGSAGITGRSSEPSGVAVALNGNLVTRGAWTATSLQEADQIEVLTANPGG